MLGRHLRTFYNLKSVLFWRESELDRSSGRSGVAAATGHALRQAHHRRGAVAREPQRSRLPVLLRGAGSLAHRSLRATECETATPGLVRGLSDERLVHAIRAMHGEPARPWSVAALARQAALSRSTFFERFNRTVGMAPMRYLLTWRMALAKRLLQTDAHRIAGIAARVGYRSASTFSVAFSRLVGMSPSAYARTPKPAATPAAGIVYQGTVSPNRSRYSSPGRSRLAISTSTSGGTLSSILKRPSGPPSSVRTQPGAITAMGCPDSA